MAKKIGVIAGIGDKSTDTNVIMPKFDAAFRLATLSTDCVVLDGLTLSDGILKAGHAVYKGYVCELESDTVWSGTNVFLTLGTDDNGIVNACYFSDTAQSKPIKGYDSVTKTFPAGSTSVSIGGSISPIGVVDASQKPTILSKNLSFPYETKSCTFSANTNKITWWVAGQYTAGIPTAITATMNVVIQYYIYLDGVALISDGVANSEFYTYQYPRKTRVADKATKLLASGTIDGQATATTQPVDDVSKKVATTEFVSKQIAKDIDAGTANVIVYNNLNNAVMNITLRRKARYVYIYVTRAVNPTASGMSIDSVHFTIPNGFLPKSDFTAYLVCRGWGSVAGITTWGDYNIKFNVSTTGTAVGTAHGQGTAKKGTDNDTTDIAPYYGFGYECQG